MITTVPNTQGLTGAAAYQAVFATQEDLDKNLIQSILNLDCTNTWDIIDREGSLAMVHYREGCDMQRYGHLRGLVIDLERQVVVADSYGYVPTVVTDQLIPANNHINLTTTDGYSYQWHVDDVFVYQEFRGVTMRVIWFGGKCYHLTHRKIKSDNSFWGTRKTFLKMYQEAGGPTPAQLFDCTKPYSSTCYEFIIVDPSLVGASRQRVDAPYLVYLGKREMDLQRAPEEVEVGTPTFTPVSELAAHIKTPLIYEPSRLSFTEANAHLTHGFYPHIPVHADPRQRTGESLVLHHYKDGQLDLIVKVHSTSYDWRYVMRGNKPDLMQQFYSLFNIVYPELRTPSDWDRMCSYLPLLSTYTEEALHYLYNTRGGIFSLSTDESRKHECLLKRRDRIHLLWCNFVLALPLHLQPEGISLFKQYQEDQNDLLAWICAVGRGEVTLKTSHRSGPRVQAIYRSAYQSAAMKVPNLVTTEDHRMLHEAARYNIINMLGKEHGASLYGMVRDMHSRRKKK